MDKFNIAFGQPAFIFGAGFLIGKLTERSEKIIKKEFTKNMNKKIILSLAIIGAVAAIAVGGTVAYFTDTETSTGNTFTAGTIDIAVNGQNPWRQTGQYKFDDMKPSQVEYSNFVINNVGTNPVNVWKQVDVVSTNSGEVTEPECKDQGGLWDYDPGVKACNWEPNDILYTDKNDIDTAITYDLSVVLKDNDDVERWNQTLYNMNKTIAEIQGNGTYLGMIPAGWSMEVTESYHMLASTTNWAQGDVMNFNITITAEQLKGTAILENKDQAASWRVLGEDAYKGTLTYGVKDSKFNYSFSGIVPLANTSYSLIVYKEPWSDPADGAWPRSIIVLGSEVSDGTGNVNILPTSVELGINLINAKVWLVQSSDLNGNTMDTWNGSTEINTLFDTGLIDYYKSGI